MEKITLVCFLCSILGLSLVYAFSSDEYLEISPEKISKNCGEKISFVSIISDTYYSGNGNRLAPIGDSILILNNVYISDGDKVRVEGKSSMYKGKCWIFSDKVVLVD